MPSKTRGSLRAREISVSDFDAVAGLLGKGIGYSKRYFLQLLQVMTQLPALEGFPKYGRLLECDGTTVGAIIFIFSSARSDGITMVRCHVTGWCVEPAYRCYATMLVAKDLRHSKVTYLNISAQPDTLPLIEVQGFTRYSSGQFLAVPFLQFASGDRFVKVMKVDGSLNAPFDQFERDLLLTHAQWGCICLWCVTPERAYPFVFRPRLFKRVLPGVQLIYCREIEHFVRFAGPIGRFLLSRGKVVVRIDSNGPIRGLIGKFMEGVDPRYYRGPKPRIGDLSYTHLAMCAYVPRKRKPRARTLRRLWKTEVADLSAERSSNCRSYWGLAMPVTQHFDRIGRLPMRCLFDRC